MSSLQPDQIQVRLASLDGWTHVGDSIRKNFTFDGFSDAIHFVDRIAQLAEKADHHPDIDIRYNAVTLTLSTHSAGGLTNRDFDLASSIDAVNP
jgi:4a-hydroxytetrahydrobiopterin dehydratase